MLTRGNVRRSLGAGLAILTVAAAVPMVARAEPAQAQAPAAAPDNSVQAAPELAPGIAPGVVPGAKPGAGAAAAGRPAGPGRASAAAAPAPTATPELAPGIAPGVAPGAKPGPAAAPSASSHAAGSPDWPCMQRKVYKLTSTQIWDGPPVDDLKGWENDEKISELTTFLESRRVPLEDAEKAIKEFAASLPEGERDQKLTLLFASVLAKINSDRSFVIGRVEEFQTAAEGALGGARARGAEARRDEPDDTRRRAARAARRQPDARAAAVQLERADFPGAAVEPDRSLRDPGPHRAARLRDRPAHPRADEVLTPERCACSG